MVDFLQTKCAEVESRKRKLEAAWDSVSTRMSEIDFLRESLDKRECNLEERERGFFVFEARRKRELASEEKELSVKRARFYDKARMREEELEHCLTAVDERAEWLARAEADIREIRRRASERLKKIEAEGESLRLDRELLAEREKKVNVIINALDGRISAVEEKEGEFNLFVERKMREIALKQENLDKKWKECGEQARLADDNFREKELLKNRFMERIKMAEYKLDSVRLKMDERFEEIECRDNAGWELLALTVKEADLIKESVEKKLEELEKMKTEFISFQENKMKELALKEQLLDAMSEKLVKDIELRNQELIEREKLGHRLLERLQLAKDNVEGLKRVVDKRFYEVGKKMRELASEDQLLDLRSKKVFREAKLRNEELIEREKMGRQLLERLRLATDIVEGLKAQVHERHIGVGLKETELDSLREWVEKKMDEADLKARELQERDQRTAEKEEMLISKEKELEDRHKARSEKLDSREKNLNSVREFTRNCFKEHLAIKGKLRTEKDLVEKRSRDLVAREQQLNHAQKKLEFKEKQMMDTVKLLELKQHSANVFNDPLEIKPDESADLKFMVRMDGKTLQMFLNDAEKDMESIGDEIFKVLHLSSDPAKLVLDAMAGFYPPHLREVDVEFNVRRTCIILLEQLIKMSPTIKPYVREEAIELATSWKSKLRAAAQNAKSLEGGFSVNLAPKEFIGKLLNLFDSTAHRVVGGLPPPIPTAGGAVHGNENHYQSIGPRVSSSQSTMAMSSLVPQSMEPINEWKADNKKNMHTRSVSEPDFGRSPMQSQADPSKEASPAGTKDKASAAGGTSRLGRFSFGSQLFQKTVGLVLKPRQGRQAKLGETNKFYYDEKLKRWVEEGAEPPAPEATLPPPPKAVVFQNGASEISSLQSEPPHNNGNLEFKSPSAIDNSSGMPPLPPTANQYSARGRMGVRSRYVDTFNRGGGNTVSGFQSPSVPSAKPAGGVNPKFFVPAPVSPAEQPVVDTHVEETQNASTTNENPSSSPNDSFHSPPPSSSAMQRFGSMSNIYNKGMNDGSFASHSRRTASWGGSLNDSMSPPDRTQPLGEAIGIRPSPFMPSNTSLADSSVNGGSLGDELQEVEL